MAWSESKHPRDSKGRFTTVGNAVKGGAKKVGRGVKSGAKKVGGGFKKVGRGVKHVNAGLKEREKAGSKGVKDYEDSIIGSIDKAFSGLKPETQDRYRRRRADVYNNAAEGAFTRGMEKSMQASKRKRAAKKAAVTRKKRRAASQSAPMRKPGKRKG